jgi:nickel-dependent lactate racemase
VAFGTQRCHYDVAVEKVVADCVPRPSETLSDVTTVLRTALQQPLDFPPLASAVIPGDHLALVLDCHLPTALPALRAVCDSLYQAGVAARDIEIVYPRTLGPFSASMFDSAAELEGVGLRRHDPSDRGQLSYLARSKQGDRIYLNRAVVDAEMVVLVGMVEYDPVLRYRGTTSGLYPGLSDDAGARRFRTRFTMDRSLGAWQAARQEIDEIGWLLGVQFAVQLVLGAGGSLAHVLAGHYEPVQRAAQQHLDAVWRFSVPRRADVVVAALAPGQPHGFCELGRAAAAARRVVRQGGRIILLSETAGEPGPGLRWATEAHEPAEVLQHLEQYSPSDSIATYQLADASQWAHVYLKSGLAPELVEDLFMRPVRDARDAQALLDEAPSCVFLHDAQHMMSFVEDES